MHKEVNGVAVFFAVLAFIIIVIQCCLRFVKGETAEQSKSSGTTTVYRRYRERHDDDLDDPTNQVLLESGPSRVISHQRGQTAASPVVVPPYPVEARHPTPQAVPPSAGFATHNPPYPTHNPHPITAPFYYPPPVGGAPYPPVAGPVLGAPYPPTSPPVGHTAPYPDYSANPPSYSEAVGQPAVPPPVSNEGYSKQSPYNPNY